MAYVANGLEFIRAKPSGSAEALMPAGPTLKLHDTGNTFVEAPGGTEWIEVLLPNDRTTGWVVKADFKQVPDDAPPPLDQESLVRGCLTVERQLNAIASLAPWHVTADYLIVRALLETGLSPGSVAAGSPIGPFALSDGEWTAFRQSGLPVANEFADGDKRLLLAQTFAVGWSMHLASKLFSQQTTANPPPIDGPNIPSYLDVLIVYLTSPEIAARLLGSTDRAQTLGAFAIEAASITAIAKRSAFASVSATTTISEFLSIAEKALAHLLDVAFDRMKTLAGDELPSSMASGSVWLTIARAEEARPVSETVNADRIAVYFNTIDFGAIGATPPPWCGAFVGHCVKTAGGTLPQSPALAASWKTWGGRNIPVGTTEIPQGAVVVLKPQAKGASGHVGFFVGFKPEQKIVLLGGNQGNAVKESAFPITEVSAIRVLEGELPVGAGNEFDMTKAGVATKFQRYGDLIVDRFRRAGFTTQHQLAAVLANAIAESSLDPNAAAAPPERSYGLFQCNQTAGVGKGYTRDQLCDPDLNTSLIIAEARRAKSFVSASTLEAAVDAFVRFVERPKDTKGEIARRLKIAKKLLP